MAPSSYNFYIRSVPDGTQEREGGEQCYEAQKGEKSSTGSRTAEIQLETDVETAISADDVSAIFDLADYLQVHTAVGLDDGISGSEAEYIREIFLGKEVCWI